MKDTFLGRLAYPAQILLMQLPKTEVDENWILLYLVITTLPLLKETVVTVNPR